MFEQVFKNIDDVLWKEAGCTTELDYVEQTSWLLFLKYLDDLEQDRGTRAELAGKPYTPIIDARHRWSVWAAPKDGQGKLDHNRALTGPDLIDYVNRELFPYLQGFKGRSEPNTIEYKIGEIFGELKNKFTSGYSLRDALDLVDQLRFGTQAEKHELSELYEAKIRKMGNAGRNGGEYYTPRPLIRAMIKVVKPTLNDRIYDGACGSCGFLCEAYDYLKDQVSSTRDMDWLQTQAFTGKEKKSLAYVIGTMNMILHGIDAPNIVHANTLNENVLDIQEKDRFDVVLANPPFGGKERPEIQQNFPIKTGETAYLFLQHFIRSLRAGGTGAVVIKNTFLSNTDNASVMLRKELLESCNLHTVLDMPQGTFQGAGVKTVVLVFEKGEPTRSIWYYRLEPGRTMGKTNPLNDADMADFVAKQAGLADGPNSWSVPADSLDPETFDLTVRNPNAPEAEALRSPVEILDEIARLCVADRVITYGVIKLGEHIPNGVPCLRTSNVRWLAVDLRGMKYIKPALSQEYRRTILRGGEVLVNVRGTLGGVAVASQSMAGWNVSREVAVVPCNTSRVDPEYLAYWIGTRASQEWLAHVEKASHTPASILAIFGHFQSRTCQWESN